MPKGISALIPQHRASNHASPSTGSGDIGRVQSTPAAIDPSSPESRDKIWQIPLAKLVSNTQQPRTFFDPKKIEELVASIRNYGIVQPLVVTPKEDGRYEIVAGERRFRAAQSLGLKTIPAILREAKELEKLELALIENLQREDLDPIERASAYRKLMDEFGLTQEEAARRLGKPRSVIANAVRILDLPSEIQRAAARGEISEGHAKVLAGIEEQGAQLALYRRVIAHDLSVRETEVILQHTPSSRAKRGRAGSAHSAEEVTLLQEALATRVEVHRRGKGGKIVVHFSNAEELRRIVRRIV